MYQVLFRDDHLLAVSKEANVLSVPGGRPDQTNLFDTLRRPYPNIRMIHRLDMGTSGLIVFALQYRAQRQLNRSFAERRVIKRYTALVEGRVAASCGEINLPLRCDWPRRPRHTVCWQTGKAAQTYFQRLDGGRDWTRLALKPVTGRSHQLRLHCQAIDHPIIGDDLYSNNTKTRRARMFLHAEQLVFEHPITAHWVELHSPAPF